MEAGLETAHGEMQRILVELETVRGELLAAAGSVDSGAGRGHADDVRALRDELSAVDLGMETIISQRTP
jgi:hypothetical protein